MNFNERKSNPNPREKSSFISNILFLWILPLFKLGRKKALDVDDMYNPLSEDMADHLGMQLTEEWDKTCGNAKKNDENHSRFLRALVRLFGKTYMILGLAIMFDECVIRVAQPIFLRLLIQSFTSEDSTGKQQYIYAAAVCLTALANSIIIHPLSFAILHIGMKCMGRVASSYMIYRKILRLSKAAQDKTTVGQLTNLFANDCTRFDYNVLFIPYILIGPLQTLLFSYILWNEVGISSIVGVGLIIALLPVQYYIGKVSRSLRSQVAQKADERAKLMSEIISAIRVVKMHVWQKSFASKIFTIRKQEVDVLRKRAYLRAFYLSLFTSASKLIPFLVFLTFVLLGNNLSADKVFFTLSIFNIIISNVLSTLPSAAAGIGELSVAISRIEKFLLMEEQQVNRNIEWHTNNKQQGDDFCPYVRMNGVFATWTGKKPTLDNVTLNLNGELLVLVIGSVGSCKTSLLQSLIAELPITKGKCQINGVVSYVSQDPWLYGNITLRNNILFGQPFDQSRYQEILSVCALQSDLKLLPNGDQTILCERGVSLSGGQKARVNLARALYQEADIYLIDDTLSSLDTKISRHIFEKCLKRYLKSSLVILVTHQLQYLSQADHIIVLNHGKIVGQGTFTQLTEQGIDPVRLIVASEYDDDIFRRVSITKMQQMAKETKKIHEKRELQLEKMAEGSVSLSTYWKYFLLANNSCGACLVFAGFIISQIILSASDYWLSFWTNEEEKWNKFLLSSKEDFNSTISDENSTITTNDDETTNNSTNYLGRNVYIFIFSGIVLAIIISSNIKAICFFRHCMKISVSLHQRMFSSLVNTRVMFFDQNPSGRVMNRFTRDFSNIEEALPAAVFDVLCTFLIMTGVVAIVIISNKYVMIPSAILITCLWMIRGFYIKTARDIKRIEAVTRSPIYTHVAATVQGLTTIRSSKAILSTLTSEFSQIQDVNTGSWFLFICSNRWFGLNLELISVFYLTFVTFGFFLLRESTTGGNIGLAISSVLTLTGTMQWGLRQSAEVVNLATSVERALEYVDLKPEETSPPLEVPKTWPSKGSIKFENVSVSYAEDKVLKNLTFEIKSQEKIGIVGRTGAGKSSIITALFRMTEPEGNIFIDGIKINDIPLEDLRKNISIIPQDPVLFSGTLRYNLDPFEHCTDHELWKALEEVELKEAISSLDLLVVNGGSNFSNGERQLVCLARAILRKNKIIVMDEATANIDAMTDNFIQKTIRQKFADCTIITIAHRLHSVIDCDKVLVLDDGCLKEFEAPHILLQDPCGFLTMLVKHSGKSTSNALRKIAADRYVKKSEDENNLK